MSFEIAVKSSVSAVFFSSALLISRKSFQEVTRQNGGGRKENVRGSVGVEQYPAEEKRYFDVKIFIKLKRQSGLRENIFLIIITKS